MIDRREQTAEWLDRRFDDAGLSVSASIRDVIIDAVTADWFVDEMTGWSIRLKKMFRPNPNTNQREALIVTIWVTSARMTGFDVREERTLFSGRKTADLSTWIGSVL